MKKETILIFLVLIILYAIAMGVFFIKDKPTEQLMTPVPSEDNGYKYEPSPCLNEDGVIIPCKG